VAAILVATSSTVQVNVGYGFRSVSIFCFMLLASWFRTTMPTNFIGMRAFAPPAHLVHQNTKLCTKCIMAPTSAAVGGHTCCHPVYQVKLLKGLQGTPDCWKSGVNKIWTQGALREFSIPVEAHKVHAYRELPSCQHSNEEDCNRIDVSCSLISPNPPCQKPLAKGALLQRCCLPFSCWL